jgi:HPr kinase/phosphorylase
MILAAQKYKVPLLGTKDNTRISFFAHRNLNVDLAPRITRHGVLMEIFGDGLLLLGESGIVKRDCGGGDRQGTPAHCPTTRWKFAGYPVKRWWDRRRKISGIFWSCEGIGVIMPADIYGMGAVKVTE